MSKVQVVQCGVCGVLFECSQDENISDHLATTPLCDDCDIVQSETFQAAWACV